MKKNIFIPYRLIIKNLPVELKKKLRQISFLDQINKLLRRKLKPDFIITPNEKHKIFLDSNDSLHLSVHGNWEEFENEIIKNNVKRGDIVLDIGANIGYYSLLLAKLVGEYGRVYAFEPEPDNFKLLKKNIKANNYSNIIAVQKAVSEKNGKIRLYLHKDNLSAHNIHDSKKGLKSIEIETIKIDDFLKEKEKKINFIKMDIEGAEGLALEGMKRILKENKDIRIISEFSPTLIENCGTGSEQFFKMLKDFDIYNLDEKKHKVVKADYKKTIESLRDVGLTNILCIKRINQKEVKII